MLQNIVTTSEISGGGITTTPLNNFDEEVGIHNLIAIIIRIRETATFTP